MVYALIAQLDRAFGYGPKGREFESSSARQKKILHRKVGYFLFFTKEEDENSRREYVEADVPLRKRDVLPESRVRQFFSGTARSGRKKADGEYLLQRAKKHSTSGWSVFLVQKKVFYAIYRLFGLITRAITIIITEKPPMTASTVKGFITPRSCVIP